MTASTVIEPVELSANVLANYIDLGDIPKDAVFTGITSDSRDVKAGFIFAALKGSITDGAEYIQYAIRMGATAAICTAEGAELAKTTIDDGAIPLIIVDNPRQIYALLAAEFYPKQPEVIVAVTGTNGKTSVASFLNQIWRKIGVQSAYFGTTGVDAPTWSDNANHTTPEPVKLHELLSRFATDGITHVAMEASSHGLDQCRMDGVHLAAGGFTNLSRDHLDYHHTMDEYLTAKARLFDELLPIGGSAVINQDDSAGKTVAYIAKSADLNVVTIGADSENTIAIKNITYDQTGQTVEFVFEGRRHSVRLDLIGAFQIDNALMAAGLAISCGADADRVFGALTTLSGVRGRMEHVATHHNGATIFVDYAHTPEALETALKALRPHVTGRLHVVFGAGGDRDAGKRPLMGQAAVDFADHVIVTDDNPRSEDPALIRSAIMVAASDATEVDGRDKAILTAIDGLGPDDVLLIAGKGHEQGQIVGDETLPFDDAEQARIAVMVLEENSL